MYILSDMMKERKRKESVHHSMIQMNRNEVEQLSGEFGASKKRRKERRLK